MLSRRKLLWNPYQDEDPIIDEFIRGVYGEECYPYIREYVDMLCESAYGGKMTLYDDPCAAYFTDELVERAEALFQSAFAAVRTESGRRHLEKEYLSVLFLKASRMPVEKPERKELIDRLYEEVKRIGITEIRERAHLEICFENLRNSRYAKDKTGEYNLYYIMK